VSLWRSPDVVRIRIEKAALPHLVLPSVSVRDGSPEPERAPLFCPDPLPWRSTTVMVPADRRAAANLRRLPRVIVTFYATLTVYVAVQLFGLLVNADWAVGVAMVLPGIFVAVLVGTALRWSHPPASLTGTLAGSAPAPLRCAPSRRHQPARGPHRCAATQAATKETYHAWPPPMTSRTA
jgi:hypothetical protein